MCQPGLTSCDGVCVNLQSESNNCGACRKACTAPAVCASGSCSTACAQGFQKCGDSCNNLATDSGHCGSCDKVCDAGVPCYGGVCGCPEGVLFCQGQCFDPTSDSAHCGTCETACGGGAACVDGKCACGVGEQLCGTDCSNLNSAQHCGSCAKACAGGEICALSNCIPATQGCPNGLMLCGDACVDLQTSAATCGSCATKCAAGQACSAGMCGCPAGKTACGTSCVDLNTSPLHCGACTTTCTAGQSCQTGQCKCAQATDIVCDNACTDSKTDLNHCGDCATKCMGGLPCTDGKCACPDGEMLCGDHCVSIDSSATDCGGCGKACPVGESCGGGKCSGAFGDACTSTLAVGISIDEISVYQVGKIPIMEKNAAVAKADRPAEIIQGKPGRVRVFSKLESGWANRTVSARLLLTNNGVKSNYFSKRNITQDSAENSFGTTFNFDVKADDFTADTHYAVEIVECDGTAAGMPGKPRFPVTDDQELVTRKTGTIKITFIPLNANGKTAASDPARLDAYKAYVALLYPTSGVEYTVGPALKMNLTVSAQGDGWSEALDQISNQHESDNAPADTYYFGLLQPTDTLGQYCGSGCVAGIGFVTDTSNFSRHQRVALGLSYGDTTSAQTMAHELGHNHGRQHSPCGGAAAPDPKFPYAGAKIGWWGFEAPEKLHNPATDTDIMGYCNNLWVSDYVYRAWTDRVAFMNGAPRELPPVGGMHHYLFLLTDFKGPRWGLERPAPRYPSGDAEQADILDADGKVIESVTVYRTPVDHLGGALLMVPDPEPGWHAIRIQGEVPLPFGAKTQSQ
jgi:Stigma-specific protein, Stig1/Peptidase M66